MMGEELFFWLPEIRFVYSYHNKNKGYEKFNYAKCKCY